MTDTTVETEIAEASQPEVKEVTNLRYAELRAHFEAGNELYLRNNMTCGNGARALIVINYPSQEGNTSFNFPRTQLPISITDYIGASALLNSASFRKLYNNGKLKFVAASKAKRELASELSQKSLLKSVQEADDNGLRQVRRNEVEKSRRDAKEQRIEESAEGASSLRSMLTSLDPRLAELADTLHKDKNKEASSDEVGDPRFNALYARVKNNMIDENDQLDGFVVLLGELDANALMQITKDTVWSNDVRAAAKSRIKDLMEDLTD